MNHDSRPRPETDRPVGGASQHRSAKPSPPSISGLQEQPDIPYVYLPDISGGFLISRLDSLTQAEDEYLHSHPTIDYRMSDSAGGRMWQAANRIEYSDIRT